jgi:hypothetical protein
MKLQALFEKVSQLITATFPGKDTLSYTFVLRKLGYDGVNRPVYCGHCNIHDTKDEHDDVVFCAVVFRPNGTLYAAQYVDSLAKAAEAGGLAIAQRRKAYGKGHRGQLENWTTYREGEIEVEGYKEDEAT